MINFLGARHILDKCKNGLFFKFSGQENDINVETENPEFSEWKWIKASKLIENAVPFKRTVYKTILDEFSDIF